MRATRPLGASSIRLCKQDVGGLKASHGGGFLARHAPCRPVLTLSAGAEIDSSLAPIQRRRSASYVITRLNWSWAAEPASALIRAVELKWPSHETGDGSLGWEAAVKGSAWVGCAMVLGWMALSLWMADDNTPFIKKNMVQFQFVPANCIFCSNNTAGCSTELNRATIPVCLVSGSTGTQICRAWCTNSTATWSSAWTLEETTNSCSMSCATSSKQVRGEFIQFNTGATAHWYGEIPTYNNNKFLQICLRRGAEFVCV